MIVSNTERIRFDISDIIIPYSEIINKSEKAIKYQKLSSIPIKEQRESYKIILKMELS